MWRFPPTLPFAYLRPETRRKSAVVRRGGRRSPGVTRGPGVRRARLRERPFATPHRTHIGPKDPPPRLHRLVPDDRTANRSSAWQGAPHRDLNPRRIPSVEPEYPGSTPATDSPRSLKPPVGIARTVARHPLSDPSLVATPGVMIHQTRFTAAAGLARYRHGASLNGRGGLRSRERRGARQPPETETTAVPWLDWRRLLAPASRAPRPTLDVREPWTAVRSSVGVGKAERYNKPFDLSPVPFRGR